MWQFLAGLHVLSSLYEYFLSLKGETVSLEQKGAATSQFYAKIRMSHHDISTKESQPHFKKSWDAVKNVR